jgi:hypothetical protein
MALDASDGFLGPQRPDYRAARGTRQSETFEPLHALAIALREGF